MLRERYAPMNVFDLVPTLRMARDPVLTQWDRVLDDDTLFQSVQADLAGRFPRTLLDGRPSTPVEVLLRLLVVKHLYGWSYEATERWGSDRLGLRQFCRGSAEPVPDETTLIRWANLIQPATRHHLLEHVVGLARSLKVTRGRTLRIDGTVVATHIHHPTDSTLLYDGVRVLSQTLAQATQAVHAGTTVARTAFRGHTRRAKRQMKRSMAAARQRGVQAEERRRTAYQHLLDITTATAKQAEQVSAVRTAQATTTSCQLVAALNRFVPLGQQVMPPTTRRICQGEAVPAPEKAVSLFEPHTASMRTGKPGCPTAFGRVLWWDEVEGGIISRYAVLEGNPAEDAHLPPRLDPHRRVCKRPPRLLAGDRGVHSTANEQYAAMHGVKKVVLPTPGATSAKRIAHEQPRWFRQGHNGRAGIDGRLSGLKRRHKLDRCRSHGTAGMERWVGWGVMVHTLRVIAQATAAEPARQVPKVEATSLSGQTLARHKSAKGFCTEI
jgi:transposase, IS5 family